ncbi:MAG: glycosyltransferase [Polyangiaceae bacterium]
MSTVSRPRVVLLHAPVGGGHRAAAEALAMAVRSAGIDTEVLDAFTFAPKSFTECYRAFHFAGQGLAPKLYGRAYFRANQRSPFDSVRADLDLAILRPLVSHLRERAPDVVVATHHLALVAVARAKARGELSCRIACVVTDYTAHAVWAVEGVDVYFVANSIVADELASHGVPRSRIVCTGIPVKQAFSEIPPLTLPEANGPLQVLLTSGGFGVGPIVEVLRGFAGLSGMELTVVCGASDTVRTRASTYAKRYGLKANVLGFVRDMPSLMAGSHVVVGKAGGLTVTETLTAARPLVIVGAVPGNEAMNETWVTMGGAGASAAPSLAGATILSLAGRLGDMGARGREMVARNAASEIARILAA